MSIKRRDFLLGAASVGLMAANPPWGPGPFDPRQPRPQVVIPDQSFRTRPYTMQPSASPVHLSANVVLRANTSGSVPAAALKNPMGKDMELLEIKFEISGPGDASAFVFGGTISCELTMGTHRITNGSIPVWNFGRAENLAAENNFDVDKSYCSYSWRLPRPLFIPAGAVLVPKFSHSGFVSDTVNVRVGYSCRTVFVQPRKIYLPWVAKYASKAFNPIENADVDVSSELDLVNPHPEVFHLQRFVGRTQILRTDQTASENDPQYFGSRYLQMRMVDSYGRPILRNFAPFRSVFGALTRSWEMDNGAELDPEAYYRVNLRKDALTLAGGSNDIAAVAQAFISMVGWRELEGGL